MKRKYQMILAFILCIVMVCASCGKTPDAGTEQDSGQSAEGNVSDASSDTDKGEAEKPQEENNEKKDNPYGSLPDNFDPSMIPEGMDISPEEWDALVQEYTERQNAAELEKQEKEAAAAAYVPESISYLAEEQNPKKASDSENESDGKIRKVQLSFNSDGTFEFAQEPDFYENDVELTIDAPDGCTIFYTLDGSLPTKDSSVYSEPLHFEKQTGKFPDCAMLRACTFDASGNQSKVAARSYLVAENAKTRFSTLVVFVSGDPAEITDKPDGIFAGYNYKERGRESERMVYVEAFDSDAENIFSQFAGVRIYGGASRESTIKSMKLFSRKSYDEDNKNFKIKSFGTEKLDGSGEKIKKYDKLVLRNSGNDLQFSYIRDELSQTLCKNAGMDVYEAVLPAVAYLNGSYYGLFWLHENYCDKYFKEKFGDAEGEFIVAEGNDKKKSDDEDGLVQLYVDDYNEKYNRFIESDLTNDAVYKQLCDFMDVENYLDFFAWNIAMNNFDWPNNNFKCYRYVAPKDIPAELSDDGAAGSAGYGDGVFDGRWRFLPHDMDFSYNLYDQNDTKPSFNTLKVVLNPNHDRHSPLFTALMQRADCRHYFREKTIEYCNGALSREGIINTYEELHKTRETELAYFYDHLLRLLGKGDWTIWSRSEHYVNYERQIYDFAEKRADFCLEYMDELLPELN